MPDARRYVIVCAECGAMSLTASVRGWRGYRADDPELDEPPELAFYCPSCVEHEFDRPARDTGRDLRSRRWRDANQTTTLTFRVVLVSTFAVPVADAELVAAFDVLVAAGGSMVSLLRGRGRERTRLEFDLQAHNPGHARRLALELLQTLGEVTPSVPGGWKVTSLDPV